MQTPFELTGIKTTIEEGEDFCEALVAEHPGWLSMQQWGQPAGPTRRLGMFTVTIGTGRPGMYSVGSIHGEEPAGREGCMIWMRDLAESTDPALHDYLEQHSISIMPTANPSGLEDNRRTNDNGLDLNRTYDTLDQPETEAIKRWMEWGIPVLAMDNHEMTAETTSLNTATGTILTSLMPSFEALSGSLMTAVETAITGAGYTHQVYPTLADGTLRRHGAPTWKILVQLIETNRNFQTFAQRAAAHVIALNATRAHHEANAEAYETAHLLAGGPGGGAFPLGGVVSPAGNEFIFRGGTPVPAASSIIRGGVPVPTT